ncbi:hypothetical protein [Pontimicrobium sp. IMCC45349]|uniref:hypothetical protein n=1 Tax=Pontimicrobium sp. IMCC45349 TaxID=3391574 RepID=UPI00399F48A5
MTYNTPTHLSNLPIYKKAIEIFALTQKISTYLHADLSPLKQDGTEDKNIYFSGDIIQQSVSIAPEILKAELEKESYSDKRYKHAEAVNNHSLKLYNSCKRLENCNSNGRDFLPILKKELKKFRKLQQTWMLTL